MQHAEALHDFEDIVIMTSLQLLYSDDCYIFKPLFIWMSVACDNTSRGKGSEVRVRGLVWDMVISSLSQKKTKMDCHSKPFMSVCTVIFSVSVYRSENLYTFMFRICS